ncbi:AAA family ATPase [Gordonia sp. CPCC 205515]|uniref:nucleotide-binding protein n=1 Tax=Gordonia sp. CPCC 205515 TaxID=3140791 RepID=UPI003AF408A8
MSQPPISQPPMPQAPVAPPQAPLEPQSPMPQAPMAPQGQPPVPQFPMPQQPMPQPPMPQPPIPQEPRPQQPLAPQPMPRSAQPAPPAAPDRHLRPPAGPPAGRPDGPPPQQQQFHPPQQHAPAPHYAPQGFGAPGFGGPGHAGPGYGAGNSGDGLESAALLRKARRAPRSGWRRTVHRITGGMVNPGESQQTVYYDHLVRQVNAPVRGDFRIAVLSLKGGVGKTTTTVGLGSTFANLRGDRVIAVDANPDLGTLSQRVRLQTASTVRDVLLDDSIFRYSDIRRHTSQSSSRLEVLASERDPATAETFNEQDYRSVMRVLQRYYNIILTDCGTGLSHSAMNGVLDLAQALILVSTPALDGARSASATLDWLEAHGYGHLVSRAVVVLSGPRKDSTKIDVDRLAQHFLARTRAVQIIPYDDHLAEGAEVDLSLLDKTTRRSFVELAATVAEDFAVAESTPEQHYQ